MQQTKILFIGLILAALGACGSPAEEPAEQLIVAKPGAGAPPDSSSAPAAGDLASKGKAIFAAACAACHSVEAGEASGTGPNLHGILGAKAGGVKDFAYSQAMKTSGVIWTPMELDMLLANPAAKFPGTAMAAGKLIDAADREAVIAYLADISK